MRLDVKLVELGLARSRKHATDLIDADRVLADSKVARKASLSVGDEIKIEVLDAIDYVSRAGHKLAKALEAFGEIEVQGKLALDVGASTGGFTDVLLRKGARQVIALDVGHDQLVPELRENSRVVVLEGFNAREMSGETLAVAAGGIDPKTIELVVADLSFISLTLVLEALVKTMVFPMAVPVEKPVKVPLRGAVVVVKLLARLANAAATSAAVDPPVGAV